MALIKSQPVRSESEARRDRIGSVFGPQFLQTVQVQDDLKNIGRPDRPAWESLLGQDGLMKEQYQLGAGGMQTGFLDRMRDQALRDPGQQSQWRQLAGQQLDQRQAAQGDQLARQQAGQQSQAMNRLAMTGGLRGGAGERMAGAGANNALLEQQRLARQGNQQRLGLDVQDEQNRLQGLSQLGNAEMQVGGFNRDTQKYNIDKALQDTLQKRASDLNFYNEDMRAWAAERTAQATPSGGGKK